MPALSLLTASLLLPLAAAPVATRDPVLTVSLLPAAIRFAIDGPMQPFVGVVLVSPSADLAHFFVSLPPLLADGVVMAFGAGDAGGYQVRFPDTVFPAGVLWHVQGVTIEDQDVRSSNTAAFVLDLTVGG